MILGHMVQGDWIEPNEATAMEVSVYFELLRLWDSRAVWWKMENDAGALTDNIAFADSRKAKTMFTFGEPPLSALMPGKSKVPTMEAWVAFVDRIARSNVDVLEGWNEPMYAQYWDGTMEQLVELQRALYERRNGKLVLSPSFVRVELLDGQEFLERYVAAGGLQWCDAIAWHGYCEQAVDLKGQVAALRKVVGTKPLWNTEYVVGTGLSQMQESLMLQASLGVECAVWNAEMPGSEDYTDATMLKTHELMTELPKREGCMTKISGKLFAK
jgi:hypothetical protein